MTLNAEYLKSRSASCTHISCLGNIVVCLRVFLNEQSSFSLFSRKALKLGSQYVLSVF